MKDARKNKYPDIDPFQINSIVQNRIREKSQESIWFCPDGDAIWKAKNKGTCFEYVSLDEAFRGKK